MHSSEATFEYRSGKGYNWIAYCRTCGLADFNNV